MIRIIIPYHLKSLANITGEVQLDVQAPVTLRSALDELESRYPMLRGTIRDHSTGKRRDFIRFFACEKDLSNEPPDVALPEAVTSGAEPLLVVGAIAGG
jgi:sulfur-carrier protein